MALMTWPLTSDGAGAVTFTANDWRTIVTALFSEGTLGASSFAVTERALGANMTLDIAAGVAVLEGDDAADQGRYLVREDAATASAVTIGTADATNPRIDLVGIQLNDPSEGGAAGRNSVFAVEAGTAAASPSAPTTPDSFLVLAQVLVPAGAVSIDDADITDTRTSATLAHTLVDGGTLKSGTIVYRRMGGLVTVWTETWTGTGSPLAILPVGFRPVMDVEMYAKEFGTDEHALLAILTNGTISSSLGKSVKFSVTFATV